MHKFPILYSRSSGGATQQWQVIVDEYEYFTEAGQVGGTITTSARTKAVGKNRGKANETSDERQAMVEAEAKFAKKKKEHHFEDINAIDQNNYFEPQLAKNFEDYQSEIDLAAGGWCVSPKLDGLRVVLTAKGAFSRNGREFVSFPHFKEILAPFFAKYPDLVLDGECYQHSFKDDFNKIISLAKKSKPTKQDIDESAQLLQYHIFDCGSMDAELSVRLEFVKWLVSEVNDARVIYVPHETVKSTSEVEAHLAEFLKQGYEGVMLKNLKALYQNKRTKDVLKYKLFQTEEFEIIDIIEGDGGRSGKFGRAKLATKEGRIFESNARGNDAFYIDLLKNKHKYIGQMATVRFQNWTPGECSCPRFPVIIAIRNYE